MSGKSNIACLESCQAFIQKKKMYALLKCRSPEGRMEAMRFIAMRTPSSLTALRRPG